MRRRLVTVARHLPATGRRGMHATPDPPVPPATRAARAAEAMHSAELALMRRLLIRDVWRLRAAAGGVALAAGAATYALWPTIKRGAVEESSGMAAAVLRAEDVQAQAAAFAGALVRTVLEDAPTRERAAAAAGEVAAGVLEDPAQRARLMGVLVWALAQPDAAEAAARVGATALARADVVQAAAAALTSAFHAALDDPSVQAHATSFVRGVLADEGLRRQGGS